MLLKYLKRNMLLPEKEIMINKTANIRGTDFHLISITSEEHRKVLWVMYQLPYLYERNKDMVERPENITVRDQMTNGTKSETDFSNVFISEMLLQNQRIIFSSSSMRVLQDTGYEGYMQLQHFVEKGLDITKWDEVDLSLMAIGAYEMKKDQEFPDIDLSKELAVTLKISKRLKQVLINQPMTLDLGEQEPGDRQYFYDSVRKENRAFYIDKLTHYDIWGEAEHKFEEEWTKALTTEQVEQAKKQYLEALERVCPKGMDLAILEYETEDDLQLNFYSKEYLEEKPVPNTSAILMMFKPDKEFGINGFKSRICAIKPVEKDFKDSIDIELFSCYMEIPEEIITL